MSPGLVCHTATLLAWVLICACLDVSADYSPGSDLEMEVHATCLLAARSSPAKRKLQQVELTYDDDDDDPDGSRWADESGGCSGPMKVPKLNNAEALRKKLVAETRQWQYLGLTANPQKQMIRLHNATKARRLLDVGMGQGPFGVVALENGFKQYTGVDPALCINKNARTRNRKISHTMKRAQCDAKKHVAPAEYAACSRLLNEKYMNFPFTGIEMMQGYGGHLQLIPGTFETVADSGFLKVGGYDLATLFTVTEHLQDIRGVLEGIHKYTGPGASLFFDHQAYYGYSGHHGSPGTPEEYKANPYEKMNKDCGQWRHLNPTCPAFSDKGLNRVRLSDLLGLLDVYFSDCKWAAKVQPGTNQALDSKLMAEYEKRGFEKAELLISHYHGLCKRRPTKSKVAEKKIKASVFFHPPTDGSYKPRRLSKTITSAVLAADTTGVKNVFVGELGW